MDEYTTCSFDDILDAIEKLDYANSQKGLPYKLNTKNDYKTILKGFYQFLIKNKLSDIDIEDIKSIKTSLKDCQTKTANDILSESEIASMIRCSFTIRDKALIYVMYEGGFRACEIGNMKWNQVKIDEYGVIINVDEKTKKERYVRLVAAKEYLIQWKNNYPFKPSGENFVFLKNDNTPLTYSAIRAQFNLIAKRTGFEKKVTPHLFRHSRITQMIRDGYSESMIKKMMWGNINTKEFETYLHLCNQDIDNEIFLRNGIRISNQDENHRLDAVQCPNCQTVNPKTFSVCARCGRSLDLCASSDNHGFQKNSVRKNLPPDIYNQILALLEGFLENKD
ncbi:site-specific integrase [Methanochimaera problematica]|uniref:site-specific integrase n=1 Tax=Methanochimaera problematica TaxID=2609417 RepID=UPI002938F5FA|nr:site-specific integrase [Methanoplanus sp. FWC-SCC4]